MDIKIISYNQRCMIQIPSPESETISEKRVEQRGFHRNSGVNDPLTRGNCLTALRTPWTTRLAEPRKNRSIDESRRVQHNRKFVLFVSVHINYHSSVSWSGTLGEELIERTCEAI